MEDERPASGSCRQPPRQSLQAQAAKKEWPLSCPETGRPSALFTQLVIWSSAHRRPLWLLSAAHPLPQQHPLSVASWARLFIHMYTSLY